MKTVCRVVIACDYFLPGFKGGGPIATLRNLLARFGHEFDFRIVTRDRDAGDAAPYPAASPGEWMEVAGGKALYLPESEATIGTFGRLFSELRPDVAYINSALSRRFSLYPLTAIRLARFAGRPVPRIVLAPRGEFSRGALALKPVQKKLYLPALKATGIWRHALWQASSPFERDDIRAVVGASARTVVVPDLPHLLLPPQPRPPKMSGTARLAFIGRITRMKNLDGAIAMLAGVSGEASLHVYGPIEDHAYWDRCLALASTLPPGIRVHYEGPVAPDAVSAVFAQADALLLPSHGENFGHVVIEALGAGCPVVLSDRTPWRGLQASGIGWDLPLDDVAGFANAIQQIVDMDDAMHAGYRGRARSYAEALSGDENLLAKNRALFDPASQHDLTD